MSIWRKLIFGTRSKAVCSGEIDIAGVHPCPKRQINEIGPRIQGDLKTAPLCTWWRCPVKWSSGSKEGADSVCGVCMLTRLPACFVPKLWVKNKEQDVICWRDRVCTCLVVERGECVFLVPCKVVGHFFSGNQENTKYLCQTHMQRCGFSRGQ